MAEEEKVIGKGWKEAANGSRETPMENRAGRHEVAERSISLREMGG